MPRRVSLSRDELTAFFKKAVRRERGRDVDLSHALRERGVGAKVACVVSKKAIPRAVDRNRVRRRVRAALSPVVGRVTIPVALVFFAKASAAERSFAELSREAVSLAARALSSYNIDTTL